MANTTIPDIPHPTLILPWNDKALAPSFEAKEIEDVAFILWQRGSGSGLSPDDCGCCKGEAQQCYASCR